MDALKAILYVILGYGTIFVVFSLLNLIGSHEYKYSATAVMVDDRENPLYEYDGLSDKSQNRANRIAIEECLSNIIFQEKKYDRRFHCKLR